MKNFDCERQRMDKEKGIMRAAPLDREIATLDRDRASLEREKALIDRERTMLEREKLMVVVGKRCFGLWSRREPAWRDFVQLKEGLRVGKRTR